MTGRELHLYFKYLHGSYNTLMFLLFCYQGCLGLLIRRRRMQGGEFPQVEVLRHRKAGPVLAVLGTLGFFVGLALVGVFGKGNLLEHPPHLFTGMVIVLLLGATYAVSRRIRGAELQPRELHFKMGLAILFFYSVEIFLGLGILL
ncbi:MAG TPA: hypothetical protein DCS05_12025 [Nitrospiraceae bacterium]|nr:hypothetical protein [Nitrospiraceae bacterium]